MDYLTATTFKRYCKVGNKKVIVFTSNLQLFNFLIKQTLITFPRKSACGNLKKRLDSLNIFHTGIILQKRILKLTRDLLDFPFEIQQ